MNRVLVACAMTVLFVASDSSRAATYQVLHSFSSIPGGGPQSGPYASVTLNGTTIFGTTFGSGGSGNSGIVFSMNTDGSGYQVIHDFAGTGGPGLRGYVTPIGSTLYSTTSLGGTNKTGSVFRVNTDGSGFQTLYSFDPSPVNPPGVFTSDGPLTGLTSIGPTLYGTSRAHGDNNAGTIFSLNADGSDFQILHSLGGQDGSLPFTNLIASGSSLYGTAIVDGPYGKGTIFSMDLDGSHFQTIHAFAGGPTDGDGPTGLTLSGSTLYGTTVRGGQNGNGGIFSMNVDGSDFHLLHGFGSLADPQPNLVLVGSTLFGTTRLGGVQNRGTVFSLQTDGSDFQVMHSFAGGFGDGSNPHSGLTLSGSRLYGTTEFGGNRDAGTVFWISVPEPSTYAMALLGGVVLCGWRRQARGG